MNIAASILGLIYAPTFITPAEETELLLIIDQQEWNLDLKRRTQHYGYRYDYKARVGIKVCIWDYYQSG